MHEKISSTELTSNCILRISDKKTMQLLREYKKEECLWNSMLDDYPNKTKRAKAAAKIAKILNIKNFEGRHVMIKFKNLRNSYSQELKKIKHSLEELGPNSPLLYRPRVQWFPLMDSFIRPHLQPSRQQLDANMKERNVSNVKVECYQILEPQEDWALQTTESTAAQSYPHSEMPSGNEDVVSNDSRAKRRRRSNSSGPSEGMNQSQVFLNDVTPVIRSEDTYDSFGKYIASLLRNLPSDKALCLQPKIVDMVVAVSIESETNNVTTNTCPRDSCTCSDTISETE